MPMQVELIVSTYVIDVSVEEEPQPEDFGKM